MLAVGAGGDCLDILVSSTFLFSLLLFGRRPEVGQGPTVLAVGAGGDCLDILVSSTFLFSLLLFGRRPDID